MSELPPLHVLLIEDNSHVVVPIQSTLQELAEDMGYTYTWEVLDREEDARDRLPLLETPALVIVDMEILKNDRRNMPAGYFLLRDFIPLRTDTEWIAITGHRLLTTTMVEDKSLSSLLFDLPLLAVWYKEDFNALRTYFEQVFDGLRLVGAASPQQPRFMVSLTQNDAFMTNDGEFFYRLNQAAARDDNLLLVGPPGSRRLTVAKAIHALSKRAGNPFAYVDCRALPARIESYLTGTLARHRNGVVFADYYTSLPDATRRNLIQQCSHASGLNVRLILGTVTSHQADPGSSVLTPEFPSGFGTVLIPSLSSRTADIPLLATRFLDRRNAGSKPPKRFRKESAIFSFLSKATLPDDETSLERLIEHAATLNAGSLIDHQTLLRAYDELFGLFGPLTMDPQSREVRIAGRVLDPPLTVFEFALLEHLVRNEGSWCSQEQIKDAVWPRGVDRSGVTDDALATLVSRVRKAVDRYPGVHRYIRSSRGRGYQFRQFHR